MSDQSPSGNRWEPADRVHPAADGTTEPATGPGRDVPPGRAAGLRARLRRLRVTSGLRLGAFALVILMVGGAGGFGLARLVGDDHARASYPGHRDGGPRGDGHDHVFRGPGGADA